MGERVCSPDSGLSSYSEDSRPVTSSHRRKQELKVMTDVEEIETVVVGSSQTVSQAVSNEMARFFADSINDYMEAEEVILSEDSVGEFGLTDRTNECFEEFLQMGVDSARGNELETLAGVAQDPLSNLLAESGIDFYTPSPPPAGPSGEEESMMALLTTAEPEAEPVDQTSHFVRRSQRKRSVRHEDLVEEDSEDEAYPRRKGGKSKSRRSRKTWSRRPRSQPPDERAGPSQQQQHHAPLQRGPHQQLHVQPSPFVPQQQQQQQQQQQELQQQQQFQQPRARQRQHQFPQLQLSQQFPQQQHQISQQIAQQQQQKQQRFIPLQPLQPPQQQQQFTLQQQQRFVPLQPLQMPQQQQALQQQFTLPPPAAMGPRDTLLARWNEFLSRYIEALPKDKLKFLDERLNDRLMGRLPPIQREPGWLGKLLGN